MLRTSKQLLLLVGFLKWLIPREGRSVRFYISLLNVMICSRQSVYRHFTLLKSSDTRARFRDFLCALATVSDSRQTSVPAVLVARLLRTIYLTEVVPRKPSGARHGGPNQGYINHPQFGYGDSLQSIIRPITNTGDLP